MNEQFTYNRTWIEIEEMLDEAERKQNHHSIEMSKKIPKKKRIFHMRQFKGLEGVINSLRFVLGDKRMTKEKVLGDE